MERPELSDSVDVVIEMTALAMHAGGETITDRERLLCRGLAISLISYLNTSLIGHEKWSGEGKEGEG